MGMAGTSSRTAVTTSPVAERSGRTPAGGSRSATRTSKSTAWSPAWAWGPTPWTDELPIFRTLPASGRPGKASISTEAESPTETRGMSVSSTSSTASISVRFEIVRSRLPGLFMVPTTAVSPTSTLRRVTRPDMGARITDLSRRSSASLSPARACSTACWAALQSERASSASVSAASASSSVT